MRQLSENHPYKKPRTTITSHSKPPKWKREGEKIKFQTRVDLYIFEVTNLDFGVWLWIWFLGFANKKRSSPKNRPTCYTGFQCRWIQFQTLFSDLTFPRSFLSRAPFCPEMPLKRIEPKEPNHIKFFEKLLDLYRDLPKPTDSVQGG